MDDYKTLFDTADFIENQEQEYGNTAPIVGGWMKGVLKWMKTSLDNHTTGFGAGFPMPWFGPASTIPAGFAAFPEKQSFDWDATEYNLLFSRLGGVNSPWGYNAATNKFSLPWCPPGHTLLEAGTRKDNAGNVVVVYEFGKTYGEFEHELKPEETPLKDHWHYGFRKGDPGKHFLHDYPEEHATTDDGSTYGDGNWMTRMGSSPEEPDAGRTGGAKVDAASAAIKAHNVLSPGIATTWIIKLKDDVNNFTISINDAGHLLFTFLDGQVQDAGSVFDAYTVRSVPQNFSEDQQTQIRANIKAASDIELQDLKSTKLDKAEKGAAGGVAELDANGKVLSGQLPSYVDDVIEGVLVNSSTFLVDGVPVSSPEFGKIYVDFSSDKQYRWSGTGYRVISNSISLGETSSTAYRGDKGKAAYDHIGDPIPHVSASDRQTWDSKYEKPNGGIPGSDLADDAVVYSKQGADFKNIASLSGSGTITIDMSAYAVFFINMTGAVTLEIINPQVNKVVTLLVSGNFTLNFPSSCVKLGGTYDGTVVNYVQLHCVYAPAASYYYTIAKPA